jgi:hypothetical protein
MIEAIIGIYMLAWWGVFWLLIPRESLFRVWAFVPAAICAFAIPCLVWDLVLNPTLALALWIAGGLLPFGIVSAILIGRRKKRQE